jgi:hypothetical protein
MELAQQVAALTAQLAALKQHQGPGMSDTAANVDQGQVRRELVDDQSAIHIVLSSVHCKLKCGLLHGMHTFWS